MLMLDRTSIFTLEFTVMFRRRAELYIITSQDHKTSVVGYRNIKEKSATAVWPQQCWVRVKRDSIFLAQQLLHKHSLGVFSPRALNHILISFLGKISQPCMNSVSPMRIPGTTVVIQIVGASHATMLVIPPGLMTKQVSEQTGSRL